MARKPKGGQPTEIHFNYIKSPFFRTVKADGAWGGINPTGDIHMALYSERSPIPQVVVHALEGTQLGPEVKTKRVEKQGYVRELEVDVALTYANAVALHQWLGQKISEFEQLFGVQRTNDGIVVVKGSNKT